MKIKLIIILITITLLISSASYAYQSFTVKLDEEGDFYTSEIKTNFNNFSGFRYNENTFEKCINEKFPQDTEGIVNFEFNITILDLSCIDQSTYNFIQFIREENTQIEIIYKEAGVLYSSRQVIRISQSWGLSQIKPRPRYAYSKKDDRGEFIKKTKVS